MQKILIANRGEIAIRIIRTARKMNIKTALVYAQQDSDAAYLKEADEIFLLKGATLNETYLNIPGIIETATSCGADAIHPGYGFLSENKNFAQACSNAGIIFIGPDATAMEAMGNKIAARATAIKIGVPVTQGITGTAADLLKNYTSIPFPLLIKAAAGGGGKGMRVVQTDAEIHEALEATAREAKNYFGDDTVYIEKYIENPRHIEVQVLGDAYGNIIHLYERECSLQRRHQKIIEEAPSSTLTPEVREKICIAAVRLASTIQYKSAGTIEFLVGPGLEFYFLEMNTRIQVEHPVTELTTGIDIVEQQIRIARGEKLLITQAQVHQNGHALECRIYAEDPEQHFMPSPGKINYYKEPLGENIRIDGMQLQNNAIISGDFDPMISKLITWGNDREAARRNMINALQHYFIYGIKNNIAFLQALLQDPNFIENKISTKYIDQQLETILGSMNSVRLTTDIIIPLAVGLLYSFRPKPSADETIWERIGYWRHIKKLHIKIENVTYPIDILDVTYPSIQFTYNDQVYSATLEDGGDKYALLLNNTLYPVPIFEKNQGDYIVRHNGLDFTVQRDDMNYTANENIAPVQELAINSGSIKSPMPGKIIKVVVAESDTVKKGDLLLIVEAMKMENNILSPMDATITKLIAQEGDKVDTSTILVVLEPKNKE